MSGDLPQISASNYASTTYQNLGGTVGGGLGHQTSTAAPMFFGLNQSGGGQIGALLRQHQASFQDGYDEEDEDMADKKIGRRLVQVLIVDPNENVPLDKCLLYSGEQKLTDATDQELFFEIDIKSVLDKYNADRVKIVDKKVKERTEYLEAAKIRDLKMVVVTVAEF